MTRKRWIRFLLVFSFLLTLPHTRASEPGACGTAPLPKGSYHLSSPYGMRVHPLSGVYRMHGGLDLAAPTGTPVAAMADGIVMIAERWGCYGNVVVLWHPGDVLTLYAHLSHIGVSKGEHVHQGERIGNVGATGCVTGSHLHFEVMKVRRRKPPSSIVRVNPALLCALLRLS